MTRKKKHPSFSEVEMPDILYALGDSVRLEIARRLYNAKEPLTCLQAVAGIPNLPVSSRSHCFQMLRKGGIILSEVDGRECYNSIRLKEMEEKFPGVLAIILQEPQKQQ